MKNYKSLKAAGKVSVQKQEAAAAVYNDDGSIKTHEVQELSEQVEDLKKKVGE